MCFGLTPVSWRKEDLKERLTKSAALVIGERPVEIKETGEDGVLQLRDLFGLGEMVTNVNIPNQGQIPDLPIGAVVETNAVFRANSLTPIFEGPEDAKKLFREMCENTKKYLTIYDL